MNVNSSISKHNRDWLCLIPNLDRPFLARGSPEPPLLSCSSSGPALLPLRLHPFYSLLHNTHMAGARTGLGGDGSLTSDCTLVF